MKHLTRLLAVIALAVATMATARPATTGSGAEALEKLKSLVGHWEQQSTDASKAALDIQLTAGGSAVMERTSITENGKTTEMVTMYYLDGDQLRLTHYCMAGNQPTMRGTYVPQTKTLTFDFAGATNLKSPGDGHMHHAVYTFFDNDHLQQVWTFQKDQKDAFTEAVMYVRK